MPTTWASRSDHTWAQWPGTWAQDLMPSVASFLPSFVRGHSLGLSVKSAFVAGYTSQTTSGLGFVAGYENLSGLKNSFIGGISSVSVSRLAYLVAPNPNLISIFTEILNRGNSTSLHNRDNGIDIVIQPIEIEIRN